MAVFPKETPGTIDDVQAGMLARWQVLAAALLIAFVGLVAGTVREGQAHRIVQSATKNASAPSFAKREPMRAPAVIERRDGSALHFGGLDGVSTAGIAPFERHVLLAAAMRSRARAAPTAPFWSAALPRAPPALG